MMDFFCPRCETNGTQSDGHNYCTRCRNARQKAARQRVKQGGRATPSRAEVFAMKGFDPISQTYLSKKL